MNQNGHRSARMDPRADQLYKGLVNPIEGVFLETNDFFKILFDYTDAESCRKWYLQSLKLEAKLNHSIMNLSTAKEEWSGILSGDHVKRIDGGQNQCAKFIQQIGNFQESLRIHHPQLAQLELTVKDVRQIERGVPYPRLPSPPEAKRPAAASAQRPAPPPKPPVRIMRHAEQQPRPAVASAGRPAPPKKDLSDSEGFSERHFWENLLKQHELQLQKQRHDHVASLTQMSSTLGKQDFELFLHVLAAHQGNLSRAVSAIFDADLAGLN